MAELELSTVDELLTTTRSVRKRLDVSRPVPPSVIEECLRLAVQAPSAGDAQNWRWVAITDPERRQAIADIHRATNEEFARGKLARVEDGAERRRMQSVLDLIEHLHEVPVHVLAYALDPGLVGIGGREMPPVLLYGSVFPAVWSFQLALRSRGLGTTPLYVENEAAVAQVIGAPDGARIVSLLPVAYFTGASFRPAARLPLEEVLYWEAWGRSRSQPR